MTGSWRIAWRNLARNKRRNIATGIAIGVGFAALILLGGYLVRTERFIRISTVYLRHIGHVAIYKEKGLDLFAVKPRDYGLVAEDQQVIDQVLQGDARIEYSGKYLSGTGLIGNGCKTFPFIARGLDPEIEQRTRTHPLVLREMPDLAGITKGKTLAEAHGVEGAMMLSNGLARLLGKTRVHDDIPRDQLLVPIQDCSVANVKDLITADANVQLAAGTHFGDFSARDGEIVGTYSTGVAELEDSAITANLADMQQLYGCEAVTNYSLFLKDGGQAGTFAAELQSKLTTKGVKAEVLSFDSARLNPMYVGTMSFIYILDAMIAGVVFLVVILSILNSMTMTIIERTQEIGTLRSLGFTRGRVVNLLVKEAVILTGLSIVGGTGLAIVVAQLVDHSNVRFSPPGVAGTIQLLMHPNPIVSVVIAAVLSVLAVVTTHVAVRQRAFRNIAELLTAAAR